jgi:hypothetical protein
MLLGNLIERGIKGHCSILRFVVMEVVELSVDDTILQILLLSIDRCSLSSSGILYSSSFLKFLMYFSRNSLSISLSIMLIFISSL